MEASHSVKAECKGQGCGWCFTDCLYLVLVRASLSPNCYFSSISHSPHSTSKAFLGSSRVYPSPMQPGKKLFPVPNEGWLVLSHVGWWERSGVQSKLCPWPSHPKCLCLIHSSPLVLMPIIRDRFYFWGSKTSRTCWKSAGRWAELEFKPSSVTLKPPV